MKTLSPYLPQNDKPSTGLECRVIVPPAIEPVTLQEVKDFCKIDFATDDALLVGLIKTVRVQTEDYCNRAWILQTREAYWARMGGFADVPFPPQISIVSIQQKFTSSWQAIAASTYDVFGLDIWRVRFKSFQFTTEGWLEGQLRIEYTCGYGEHEQDVPQQVRDAIDDSVLYAYQHRGEVQAVDKLTDFSKALLNSLKVY